MTKPKNPNAVALGKLGGAVGGKSKSPAKVKASRANGAKAGKKKAEKSLTPTQSA